MSEWIEGPTATIRALARQLDDEAGYPRPPGRIIGKQVPIQQTWNGRGAVPFGWRVSRLVLVRRGPGRVGLRVTDEVRSIATRAGVTLPATVERDSATELVDTTPVDPIEDRPPIPTLTLDEAYERLPKAGRRGMDRAARTR